MTLTPRQQAAYQDIFDFYSVGREIDPVTKRLGEETVTLRYSGVRCQYVYTPNINEPTAAGGLNPPTHDSTDTIKYEQTMNDVRAGWFVVCRSLSNGGHAPAWGNCYRVAGDPKPNPTRGNRPANEISATVQSIDRRPPGIPA